MYVYFCDNSYRYRSKSKLLIGIHCCYPNIADYRYKRFDTDYLIVCTRQVNRHIVDIHPELHKLNSYKVL